MFDHPGPGYRQAVWVESGASRIPSKVMKFSDILDPVSFFVAVDWRLFLPHHYFG